MAFLPEPGLMKKQPGRQSSSYFWLATKLKSWHPSPPASRRSCSFQHVIWSEFTALRPGETAPARHYGEVSGIQFQVGVPNSADGTRITSDFFRHLEDSILKAESYRGKILSLEQQEHSYSGQSSGITVHKLRTVEREQVILPESTLTLLDRNVIQFVRQRQRLSQFRQATKKGLLFYGPPGTGKTHTIHYLAKALEGHTTLLISAEQVGLLAEYMTLARLLQPSMVIIEDVDLIARDRTTMEQSVRGGAAQQAA